MLHLNRLSLSPLSAAVLLALAAGTLAGCSSIESTLEGDKLAYRKEAAKINPLDVPPDLSQLTRDSRYQPQAGGGSISAAAFQGGAAAAAAAPSVAAATAPSVALKALGDIKVLGDGRQHWLAVPMTPEQLWPQLKAFWAERGLKLTEENAAAGVMETDWAENRAKLPQDIVRRTLGKIADSAFSTGERDKFRTRVERTAEGSEVFISHRGLQEVYVNEDRSATQWTARASDPSLETELLTRLMVKLGVREEVARSAVASPIAAPTRARVLTGQAAPSLQVDEAFEQAWRRVGLALDRSGFTVEDRDRASGLYFVRYVDPKLAGQEEPGFFAKLFSFGGSKKTKADSANHYRIAVKGEGKQTVVSVQDAQGRPENSDIGKRIVSLLADELK